MYIADKRRCQIEEKEIYQNCVKFYSLNPIRKVPEEQRLDYDFYINVHLPCRNLTFLTVINSLLKNEIKVLSRLLGVELPKI